MTQRLPSDWQDITEGGIVSVTSISRPFSGPGGDPGNSSGARLAGLHWSVWVGESYLAGMVPGGQMALLLGESPLMVAEMRVPGVFFLHVLRPLVSVRASPPCPSSLPSPGASCRPRTCPELSSPEGLVAKRQPLPKSFQAPVLVVHPERRPPLTSTALVCSTPFCSS